MPYEYFIITDAMHDHDGIPLRTALFRRMQQEGLLPFAMHAYAKPQLEDWLQSTASQRGWLLCCHKKGSPQDLAHIQAMAFFAPLPWGYGNGDHKNNAQEKTHKELTGTRVWTFDFTAFRSYFSEAAAMSRKGLQWFFAHAPCDTVLGLCAKSNRHAWRLAQKAGFTTLGQLPGACFVGRKNTHEAGILVAATRM